MRPLFALAALVALTVACGGGNTPTSPSLPPSLFDGSTSVTRLNRGTLRATVDGTPWESALATAGIGSIAGFPPQLTLTAVSARSTFGFSISGPAAVGTYDAASTSTFVSLALIEGLANSWWVSPFATGSSGTLTITTATATRVAGTFAFTAVARTQGTTPASRTVTNGTFEVSQ
jgi:Family of unknown function (DUF6252)